MLRCFGAVDTVPSTLNSIVHSPHRARSGISSSPNGTIRNRPFAAAQELKQRNEELARRVGELQSMLDSTNSALNKEMAQSLDARAKIEQAMPMASFQADGARRRVRRRGSRRRPARNRSG